MSIPSRCSPSRIASPSRCSAGNAPRRQLRHSIFVIALMLMLIAPSMALCARQRQIPSHAAPPDVHITEVKAHTADGKPKTDIEIRWTAQVSRSTTIDDFEVLLEVRYSDGSKRATRSKLLKSSARAAILQLASHPRQNSSAIMKDFMAAVRVRFRNPSSSAIAQQAQVTRSVKIERRRAQRVAGETDAFCINVEKIRENARHIVPVPRCVVNPKPACRSLVGPPPLFRRKSTNASVLGHHDVKTLFRTLCSTIKDLSRRSRVVSRCGKAAGA